MKHRNLLLRAAAAALIASLCPAGPSAQTLDRKRPKVMKKRVEPSEVREADPDEPRPQDLGQMSLRKLSEQEKATIFGDGSTIPAPEDVGAIPEGALRMGDEGIAYKVLEEGYGEEPPGPNDMIAFHYTGWLQDGRLFDTSAKRRQPVTVQVNRAGGGLGSLFQGMVEGERRQVWVPEQLADKFRDPKLEGHVVFDLKMFQVLRAPAIPADADAPPEGASTNLRGVSYVVLEPGRGSDRPQDKDLVLMHLDTWTRDGVMTASTRRGEPVPRSFKVEQMLPGFADMIREMGVGERRRVWLPAVEVNKPGEAVNPPLVAEMQLISMVSDPEQVDRDQLNRRPDDAQATESGMRYSILREGFGDARPASSDTVIVHYSVWDQAGAPVDSSYRYGKPYAIQLNSEIPEGMREALLAMVEGERRRLWVPAQLGFQNDTADGPVVIDLDLIQIN